MALVPYRRTPSRSDRKSTRLNSSHVKISYAVFCLKKKFSQFKHDSVVVYQDSLKIVTRQFYDPEYLQLEVHREQYQPGKTMIGLEKTLIQYDAWHNEVLRVDSKWDTTQLE